MQTILSKPREHDLKTGQLSYAIGLTVLLIPNAKTPEETIRKCLIKLPTKTVRRIITAFDVLSSKQLITKEDLQKSSHFTLLTQKIISDVTISNQCAMGYHESQHPPNTN